MISILREVLSEDNLTISQKILDNLIQTLEELANSENLPQSVSAKIVLETIPKIQWIKKQLPEVNKLGWGRNESYPLRKKIREVEHEFRRDLEKTRLSISGLDMQKLRPLIEKALKLSVDASFSYIKLGDRSRDEL